MSRDGGDRNIKSDHCWSPLPMSGAGTEAHQEQDIVGRPVSGLVSVCMLPVILLNEIRDVAWHPRH